MNQQVAAFPIVETAKPEEGRHAIGLPPVLLQYWRVAWRWKWVILSIVSISMVLGLVLTLLATPQYTSTTRIEISRERQNITQVQGLESERAGQDLEFFQTQYSLLEARSLAERVARALRLNNNDAFFEAHGVVPVGEGDAASSATSARSLAEARSKQVVDLLLEHVSISPVRGSALVDVGYTSASPTISAMVADAWGKEFIAQSVDRRFASTLAAREYLEDRLNEYRQRLEQSERAAANYAARKGIVKLSSTRDAEGNTTSERTLVSDQLENLNRALAEATAARMAAAGRANAGPATGETLNSTTLSALRERRALVSAEYSKLRVQFDPAYPAAEALQEQINAIDRAIASERALISDASSGAYRAAAQHETELSQRVAALKSQLGAESQDSIQYNILLREADTNRQLFEGLLQRYKEIGVAGVGASNISIIDEARVPQSPSSPSLPLNMALALVAGLGLAGLAAVALEQIDEGLRAPSQVTQQLGLPLLGSVPVLEDEDALAQLRDVKSDLSESYLSIRSTLAFATAHGLPRSLSLTSTRPAEGKTTSSIALATMLGRTGHRTLLIDADMRSPVIAAALGVPGRRGLSNLLSGEDDARAFVQRTADWPFDILPSGPTPPNAAELLSSDRMAKLIEKLQNDYRTVIVDSPPILGLADAPLISRAVESNILVVEANGVAVRGLQSALSRLHGVHANVLGVILTKLDEQQAGYGYGYGYSYGYGEREVAVEPA